MQINCSYTTLGCENKAKYFYFCIYYYRGIQDYIEIKNLCDEHNMTRAGIIFFENNKLATFKKITKKQYVGYSLLK